VQARVPEEHGTAPDEAAVREAIGKSPRGGTRVHRDALLAMPRRRGNVNGLITRMYTTIHRVAGFIQHRELLG
jgi:hypothetical protein